MRTIRTELFETNSSSTHTLVIPKQPEGKEEIIACLPEYLKEYIEKYGILFGSGKEWNDPDFQGEHGRDIYLFQEKLDTIWENLTSLQLCYFIRYYNFLKEALKKQPYKFTLNIDPSFLETHNFGSDEYDNLINESGILDDESKLFRFIFCPESKLGCHDRDWYNPGEDEDLNKVELYYDYE